MPEQQLVGNVQIRLASHSREGVVPARILAEHRVYEITADLRSDGAGQGLVAHEHVVSAAGSADAAAVQCRAHELVQIAPILDVIPY